MTPERTARALGLMLRSSQSSLKRNATASFTFVSSSVANIICLFSFFVDISGNRLFLCTARRIFKNDVPEILPQKSTKRKTRKGILHLVNGRSRLIRYVLSKVFRMPDHELPLKSFRKHDLFLVVCVSYQNEHIFLT